MDVTECRIKLVDDDGGCNDKLLAFATIAFDGMFVVRDLKVIQTPDGLFVAMPSRKLMDRCDHCGTKNHLRARVCNQCGGRLDPLRALRGGDGPAKLHADVCHPVSQAAREAITSAVIEAYYDAVAEAQAAAPKEVAHVA